MFSIRWLGELQQVVSCNRPRVISKALLHLKINTMDLKNKPGVLEADRPFTVFVEGNIGSGKTTFLSYFNGKHAAVHSEPTEIWRNIRGHNVLVVFLLDFHINFVNSELINPY